jgi:YVTN family beta-propeller protein
MKQFKLNYLFLALLLSTAISSCKKNKENQPVIDIKPERKGIYVLAEGGFNSNNSTLAYYDYDSKKLVNDQFKTANNRGLGDTGNDAKVYGSKMYIIVNVSSTLEVVDPKTAKSIKQIDFKNGSNPRQPRYIVFNKNKAFVSSFDGTVAVIDTATLAVEKFITVGSNPEQMAIANGKLYVANSGGLNYPNYDKTVSVIDLTTLTETKKITVTDNPRGVVADQYGDVYVSSSGNYSTINPALTIIDSKTDAVKQTFANFSVGSMAINGDLAYISQYTAANMVVKVFNIKTETIVKDNFIADGTVITTPYGIDVDDLTGEVFITDAKDYFNTGEVFCFDDKGNKKYSLKVGINPNKTIFINK